MTKVSDIKMGKLYRTQDGTLVRTWCVTNLAQPDMMMHPSVVVLKEENGVNYYSMILDIFPFDLEEVKDEEAEN